MPLASARQHLENQKENQAGHSSERTVEGQRLGGEPALPTAGLTLHRALHDGRPVFWCWRALANSATAWVGLRLISFILITGPPPVRCAAPSTVRPLARDPRVLVGWPFPLGFGRPKSKKRRSSRFRGPPPGFSIRTQKAELKSEATPSRKARETSIFFSRR